jgi:hypothetical protein
MKATTVIKEIHDHGKSVANDSTVQVKPEIGVSVAQGDINLWLLPNLPENAIESHPNCQLAPGTTRGSRHCIKAEDMDAVKFYRLPNPNPLQGGIMVFDRAVTIEHPEHGNQIWPAGIVAVTYQRRHAIELKRSQD